MDLSILFQLQFQAPSYFDSTPFQTPRWQKIRAKGICLYFVVVKLVGPKADGPDPKLKST